MVQKTEPVFTDFTWKTKTDRWENHVYLSSSDIWDVSQTSIFCMLGDNEGGKFKQMIFLLEYWQSAVRRWEKSHPHLRTRRKTCTAEVQSTNKMRLCVSVGGIEPSAFSRYPTGAVVERRALNNRSVCRFNVFVITRPISNLMVSLWSISGKNERWSQREKKCSEFLLHTVTCWCDAAINTDFLPQPGWLQHRSASFSIFIKTNSSMRTMNGIQRRRLSR